MKTKVFWFVSIIILLLPTACTLFIDEENGFTNKKREDLPIYTGEGYDEPVTNKNEFGEVTYQFKETTRTLFEDDELTKYIIKVDAYGKEVHEIFLDGSTPKGLLPKEGQVLVSDNIKLFDWGMCSKVLSIIEKDGQYVVLCANSSVEDAYELLDMKITPNLNEYFDTFGYLDDNGNFVDLNSIVDEDAEANGKRNVKGIAKDDDDEGWSINLDPIFEIIKKSLKDMEKEGSGNFYDWHFSGKGEIKIGAPTIDWSLKPFDLKLQTDASLTLGCELGGRIGMKSPIKKTFFRYNPPKPLIVHPVVIFPDIRADFTFDASVNGALDFSLTQHFGIGGDIANQIEDKYVTPPKGDEHTSSFEKTVDELQTWMGKYGMDAGINLGAELVPGITINIGLGLYQASLLLTPQIICQLPITLTLLDQHTSGGDPANVSLKAKFGLGFCVEADGYIVGTIIEKIKKAYKEAKQIYDISKSFPKEYVQTGTYEQWKILAEYGDDWHNFFDDDAWKKHGVSDEQRNEMYNLVYKDGSLLDLKGNIRDMVKQKAEDKDRLEQLPKERENQQKLEGLKNETSTSVKEYRLEVDPWMPECLDFQIFKKYINPKIKDGSFKIGYEMDQNNKMYYRPQLFIEDIGILPLADIYLGWSLYEGQTFIRDYVRHKPGTSSNDPGFKPSPLKLGFDWGEKDRFAFESDVIYYEGDLRNPKLRPFYYQESDLVLEDGRYSVPDKDVFLWWDKYLARPLSFTLANPFMNIQAIEPVRAFVLKDENGNTMVDAKGNVLYSGEVNVYVQVNGMSHIEEMGITQNIRNKDGSYSYKDVKMKNPDLWKNEQVFSLPIDTVNTLTPTLNLTPYIVLRPGENMSSKDPTTSRDARTTHYDDLVQKINLLPVLEGSSSSY